MRTLASSVRGTIRRDALREAVAYDLGGLKALVAAGGYATAAAAPLLGPAAGRRRFAILTRLHNGLLSPTIDRLITKDIAEALQQEREGRRTGLGRLFDDVIARSVADFRRSRDPDPARLLGVRLLVIKGARPRERGVLVVDYSYVFPLLAGLFDLAAIADRYTIVMEPSGAGVCAPEILLYTRLKQPVYVETAEPRDHAFIAAIGTNLRTVPMGANWWVDHRSMTPVTSDRDIDVMMVANWSDVKRHWRFFRALAALRRSGHRLRVALAGYSYYDRTQEYIRELARYFGIGLEVETYDRIPQEQVFALLARSKVHVLWSRRECSNRAIIEAMLADVPIILRQGLTFGFEYPYVNPQTGRFATEAGLGDAILDVIANRARYSPRQWVLEHMTCERSTRLLETTLRDAAIAAGEIGRAHV